MEVNVKVTVDLGDKTMSLFSGFMSANQAVTNAADTAGKVLKKYADEPAEDKELDVERHPRNDSARPEPAHTAKPYTEDELKEMSLKEMVTILKREFDVDPDDFDGKNTNKKLRDLVLGAQAGKLDGEPGDESDADDDPKAEARRSRSNDVTRDDARNLLSEVLGNDDTHRPAILKELNRIGAKSISAIHDDDIAGFFEFLQSLKDA